MITALGEKHNHHGNRKYHEIPGALIALVEWHDLYPNNPTYRCVTTRNIKITRPLIRSCLSPTITNSLIPPSNLYHLSEGSFSLGLFGHLKYDIIGKIL